MDNDLKKAFEPVAAKIAELCAEAVSDMLRGLTVEQLIRMASTETKPVPTPKAKPKVAVEDSYSERLVEFVDQNQGATAESVMTALDLTRPQWQREMTRAMNAGKIKRRGSKRSARYYSA